MQYQLPHQFHLLKQELTKPRRCCEGGQRINFICPNAQCSSSLECGAADCFSCSDLHKSFNCQSMRKIQGIGEIIHSWFSRKKQLFQNLQNIDEELISQLRMSQKQILQMSQEIDLRPQDQDVVNQIFWQKNGRNISGKQAKYFLDNIDHLKSHSQKGMAEEFVEYQKEMEEIHKKIKFAKKKLLKAMLPYPQTQGKKNSVQSIQSKVQEEAIEINSQILDPKDPEDMKKIQFLMHCLQNPNKLQLLYRASEHGFSSTMFHEKCDYIPDTLTLVRTEHGKTVAGFSHYTWQQKKDEYVDDSGRHVFLAQLDIMEKMVPQSDQYLIQCKNRYGPTFGGTYSDLHLDDRCDSFNTACAFFPSTFNQEEKKYEKGKQQNYNMFSGADKGCYFHVKEYEVFKITFQQKIPIARIPSRRNRVD